MTGPVRETTAMIRGMAPSLQPGRFIFATVSDPAEQARLLPTARGMFVEAEGLSLILETETGSDDAFCQITLEVQSALDGVGLTAAVATALAAEGIPANVVAAHHHDHVFVPEHQAEAALGVLHRLSRDASRTKPKE